MAYKITPSLGPLFPLMNEKEIEGAVSFSLALDISEGNVAIILSIQAPDTICQGNYVAGTIENNTNTGRNRKLPRN